ncbi:MAG: hypothetical protein ACHQPI_08205 [Thermoanaerobaculia bacterium]
MNHAVRHRVLSGLLLAGLLALGAFSFYLATHRIYQVDEVQQVYMSRILGTHRWNDFLATAPIYLLGPLSSIAKSGTTSAGILKAHRFAFLGLFWLNAVLLAVAAGARRADIKGLTILLFAATFAPLWDYGFEVRHDNVLLAAVLCAWILIRHRGALPPPVRYLILGVLAIVAQASAFKAFLYFVPMCGLALLFPNPELGLGRFRAILWTALGAALAGGLVLFAYALSGTWEVFADGFRGSVKTVARVASFSSWPALQRLLFQTPLLLAGIAFFAIVALRELTARRRGFFSWSSLLPEALFVSGAVAIFFINPTPFPYNLIFVVPPAFIAVAAMLPFVPQSGRTLSPDMKMFVAAGILVGHLGPFVGQTIRHVRMDNARQLLLAKTAETMTDPVRDRVYDAAGLVVTRDSIGYIYYLHSLTIGLFLSGQVESVRSMLDKRPASVILPNYRLTWLKEKDVSFIHDHYLPLSGDFFALGEELRGGSVWRCLHPGRYHVSVKPADRAGEARLDDEPTVPGPRRFEAGPHAIEAPDGVIVRIVWIGPTLDAPPDLGPGRLEQTFVNFY